MGSFMPHSRPGRSNASRTEAGKKRASADTERSRSTCLRLYGAVRIGRTPSATHEVSSNVVQVAGRLTGTDGPHPFSSTANSYKPDHTDRSGAGRRAARETGDVSGSEETQMTITRREI